MKYKFFTYFDILAYMLIMVVSSILVSKVAGYYFGDTYQPATLSKLIYVPWFMLSTMIILIYRLVRCSYSKVRCFVPKLGWFNPIHTFYGVLFIFAFMVVNEPLNTVYLKEITEYLNQFTKSGMWLNVAVTVLAAPFFEEYIFRGILQRDITSRWGVRSGIVMSALIFSIMHFNSIQTVTTFAVGLLLGYVYYATRYSLATVIVLHSINNLISVTAIYSGLAEKNILNMIINNQYLYYAVYVVAAIIVLKVLYNIFKVESNTRVIIDESATLRQITAPAPLILNKKSEESESNEEGESNK